MFLMKFVRFWVKMRVKHDKTNMRIEHSFITKDYFPRRMLAKQKYTRFFDSIYYYYMRKMYVPVPEIRCKFVSCASALALSFKLLRPGRRRRRITIYGPLFLYVR